MSGEKILIVEDSVTISRKIDATLKKMGYAVAAIVDNGKESIKKAYILKPDLVLMDIVLQGKMTGIEAAQEIRNNLKIPVIFLTSLTGDATLEKAVAAEPFGYLLKPLDERALKVTIQMALFKHAMEEKLAESERKCKAIIDHSFEFIGMMKTDGTLIEANRSALKKLGIKYSDVLGKPFWDTPGWSQSKELQNRLKEAVLQAASGKFVRFETWYPTIDGSDIFVDFSLKPVRDEQGNVLFLIPEVRDITERKVAEEAVMTKALQIERMNEDLRATEEELRASIETLDKNWHELKEKEIAVRESKNELNAIVRGSPIPQYVIDRDHTVINWNPALEKLSGITAKDIVGTNQQWRAFYPKERPCLADILVDGAMETLSQWYSATCKKSDLIEEAYESTEFFPHMGASGTWLYFTAAPIRDVDGRIIGAVETLEDITERKIAEEALAAKTLKLEKMNQDLTATEEELRATLEDLEREERKLIEREASLRQANEIARISRWELDLVHNTLDWSDGIYPLFEINPAEFGATYEAFLNCIHPDDRDLVNDAYSESLKTKKPYEVMHRLRMKDGRIKWVNELCHTEYDEQGQPLRSVGVVQDITKRKTVEEALRESEKRYRDMFEINNAIMLLIDPETTRIVDANAAASQYYGYTHDELTGMVISQINREDPEIIQTAVSRAAEHNGLMYQFRHRKKSGEVRDVEVFSSPVMMGGKRILHSIIQDTTERKIAEEALAAKTLQLEKTNEELAATEEELRTSFEELELGEHKLRERYKELECLYRISNFIENSDAPLNTLFQGIVELIPPAWQYPDITGARIIVHDTEFKTANFQETNWVQSQEILVHDKPAGHIEVCYQEKRAICGEGPFLIEERNLLNAIAERIRRVTERKRAEEALAAKTLQLEMMNEHLTATEQELRATLEDLELGERKLIESEERLRLLSDNLPNGMIYQVVIEKDGKRRFTYISAGVEQNHGVTAEDVLHDPMVLYNQFSEEDRVRVAEVEDRALKNRNVFDIEVKHRIPSGQMRWLHLRSVSRQLPGGTTIWDGFEIDITKSKQAEEALAITHSRLESAMMSGNLAWWEMDCVTGNVIFNERKAQMLGYPAEQFSHYTDFTKLVHPDDYDSMMQQMRDHLNGITKQYNVNYRMRSANGEYLWFHDIGGISGHASNGRPLKVSGVVMDITERKQVADALQKSEVQYRTLVENANEAILVMQDGMVRQPNRMSLEMSGYSEQELMSKSFIEFIHPEDRAMVLKMSIKRLNGEHVPPRYSFRIICKNGTIKWVELGAVLINWEGRLAILSYLTDITERKITEEQLLLKNNVFESSITANSIADKQGIITHVNPAFLKLWGHRTQEEAIGNSVSSFFAREEDGTPVLEALDTFGRWEGVFLAKRTDGSTFMSQGIATVIRDETGEPIGYQSTNLDISERKIAEEALQVSEEKYHNIYRNAALGIFHSTFAGRFIDVNPALAKMLGYNSSEEVVKSITSIADQIYVEPPLRNEVNTTALNAGGTISVENQYRRKDDTRWYGMLHLRIVPENQGKPRHFEGFVEDITERKMAELALQESENRYRTLAESSPDNIFIINRNDTIEFVNSRAAEQLHLPADEIIGKPRKNFFRQDISDQQGMNLQAVFETGEPLRNEHKILYGNHEFWQDNSLVPIRDENGNVTAVLGVARDITERKIAEEELQASEQRFRTTVLSTQFGISIIDAKTHVILDVNPKALEMIGANRNDVIGSVCHSFICPAESGRCPVMDLGLEIDCSDRVILNLRGEQIPVIKSVVKTVMGGKEVLIESFIDISDRKKAEKDLQESEATLNQILNLSPQSIFWKDLNGRYLGCNRMFATTIGWDDPAGIIGKTDFDLPWPREEAEAYRRDDREVLYTNLPKFHIIEQMQLPDGIRLWIDTSKVPMCDAKGHPFAVLGVYEDITGRKQVETYRQLSADVLGIMNEPAELKEMVRSVLAAIKLATKADAIGIRLKTNYDFPYFVDNGFSEDFLLKENTLVAREPNGGICRDSDGNVRLECTCGLVISGKTDPKSPFFTPFGSFWTNNSFPLLDLPPGQDPRFQPRNTCTHKGYASFAIIPIKTIQQQIIGTLQINAIKKDCFTPDIIQSLELIAIHISEALMRKRAEYALRDSETTIHNLLNAIPDDLALINSGRLIIAVNESMAATLGQQPELLTGRAIGDFLTSSVLSETIDRIIDPLTESGQIYFEEKQNDQWFETSVYPVTDRNGAEVRIAIQSRDITERKYLEEELKKAGLSQTELNIEKFQILNDQIRNPLQVIRGYTSLDPSKYNDKINKQVEIIDNIVTQLDMGWLESEKVQQFLLKHSHHNNQSLQKQQREGGSK